MYEKIDGLLSVVHIGELSTPMMMQGETRDGETCVTDGDVKKCDKL